MITEKDLQEAIAECQGVKKPNANTCIMLASYMTIKDHMYPDDQKTVFDNQYSFDPYDRNTIDYDSDTEFGKAVNGKKIENVLYVIDDLMDVLQVLNPALYGSVMRQVDS